MRGPVSIPGAEIVIIVILSAQGLLAGIIA
jgi:hypothetical protein